MGSRGSSNPPPIDYAAQERVAQAETARIKAETEAKEREAALKVQQQKEAQAAREAAARQQRKTLLQAAAAGDGISVEEDTEENKKRKTSLSPSLLASVSI